MCTVTRMKRKEKHRIAGSLPGVKEIGGAQK